MNTQQFDQTGQMIELSCEYLSLWCIWLYVIIMSHTSFRVNPHSIVCLNVKELLARSRRHIWSLSDSNVIRTHNHLVRKRTLNHLADCPNDWAVFWVLLVRSIWLYVYIMSRTSVRVNPLSIVYLNVKELLAWNRRHIWSLTNSNVIRKHNHLVRKRALNHLAKLAKWLSCVMNTYLYGLFQCILLSCHVRVSEWIHTP